MALGRQNNYISQVRKDSSMQRNLYTDLALEARELNPDITGVVEDKENDNGIEISRIMPRIL
jgi:hypothetical protein